MSKSKLNKAQLKVLFMPFVVGNLNFEQATNSVKKLSSALRKLDKIHPELIEDDNLN